MIIDGFEGKYAVIELDNGTFENIPKTLLPNNAKEGDVLKQNTDGSYKVEQTNTDERKTNIKNRLFDMFAD